MNPYNAVLLISFVLPVGPLTFAESPRNLSGQNLEQSAAQEIAQLLVQAESGNAEAQNALGEKYLLGQGVEKDKEEAIKWFRKSARQGNATAMHHLGVAYYNGDGVGIDDGLSYAWFRLAKEAGNQKAADAVQRAESQLKPQTAANGLVKIAEMYEKGDNLPANQTEAERWWSLAAAGGDYDAQVTLAFKKINGQGIPQDYSGARRLCEEVAKQREEPRAEYCLGYIYQHGLGVDPDAKKARTSYGSAAHLGHVQAAKNLASMELAGEGGKVDRVSAFLLYAKLAKAHDEDALRSLVSLRTQITEKEWKALQKPLFYMGIDPSKLDDILQRTKNR